jgi:hypothetical protein
MSMYQISTILSRVDVREKRPFTLDEEAGVGHEGFGRELRGDDGFFDRLDQGFFDRLDQGGNFVSRELCNV